MREDFYTAVVIRTPYHWGLCLGRRIYVGWTAGEKKIRHEFGHHLQWKKLGPLYWFVIALPSLLHAGIYLLCGRRWNYNSFYTEAWANRLSDEFFGEGSA